MILKPTLILRCQRKVNAATVIWIEQLFYVIVKVWIQSYCLYNFISDFFYDLFKTDMIVYIITIWYGNKQLMDEWINNEYYMCKWRSWWICDLCRNSWLFFFFPFSLFNINLIKIFYNSNTYLYSDFIFVFTTFVKFYLILYISVKMNKN